MALGQNILKLRKANGLSQEQLGEKVNDPIAMYLEDLMSVSLNLAGVPGLAVPVGKTKSGLPIGLQLVGPRRSDKALIEFAKELK